MSFTRINENLSNQINASLGYYGKTQQDFFDDIELYKSGKLGFRQFKTKWKYFFDLRKQFSNKAINTKKSLTGLLNRLSNPNHYSNIPFIKDFQELIRNAWINKDFMDLRLKYHKNKSILVSNNPPANFKGKTAYFYEYREKKIGINGFLSNHYRMNNWNDIKHKINTDLNIIKNTLKFQKPNEKLLFGFKLWLEIFDRTSGIYTLDSKGIKTQILFNKNIWINEIDKKLKELEMYFFFPKARSRILEYHIYISRINITQYKT